MNEAKTGRLLAGLALLVALAALVLAFVAWRAARQSIQAQVDLVNHLAREREAAKKRESPAGRALDAVGVPGGKIVGKVVDEVANPVAASALPDKFTWRNKCWVRVRKPVASPDKLASLGNIGDLRFPRVFRGWRCEHFEVPRRDLEYVKCSREGELVWYRVSKEVEPSTERVGPRRRL